MHKILFPRRECPINMGMGVYKTAVALNKVKNHAGGFRKTVGNKRGRFQTHRHVHILSCNKNYLRKIKIPLRHVPGGFLSPHQKSTVVSPWTSGGQSQST